MSKLGAVGLALLLAMVISLVWQSGKPPTEEIESARSNEPRYRIENLRSLRTDDKGQPLLRLTADSANYFDDGAAALANIEAAGLSGAAAPWTMKSPTGTVAAGEKRLLLQAPVTGGGRWNTGEAFTLTAQAVWVDDAQQRFYSTQPLTLAGATRNGRAQGFTASFDGVVFKMQRPELQYDLRN